MTNTRNESPAPLALGPRDAAKALGISERLLWSRTKAGEVPHRRIGKRVLYPVRLLNEWLESQNS